MILIKSTVPVRWTQLKIVLESHQKRKKERMPIAFFR